MKLATHVLATTFLVRVLAPSTAAAATLPTYVAAVIEKVADGFSPYQKIVSIKVDNILAGPARTFHDVTWWHCYEGAAQNAVIDGMLQRRKPRIPKVGARVILKIDRAATAPSVCDNVVMDDSPAARWQTIGNAIDEAETISTATAAAAFKNDKVRAWIAQSSQTQAPNTRYAFEAIATIASPAREPTTRITLKVTRPIRGVRYGQIFSLALPRAFAGHALLYREGELLAPCVAVFATRAIKNMLTPAALRPCGLPEK